MTKIYITSGTTWVVPNNWNNSANTIECIGAGGSGSATGGGGGGGAYSARSNISLTAGSVITIQCGIGGDVTNANRNTYFNGANLAASTVGAEGGFNGSGTNGGAGGAFGQGTGTTNYSGGGGGSVGAIAGGGGGAAGPSGAGVQAPLDGSGNGGAGDNGAGGAAGLGSVGAGGAGGNGTEYTASFGSGGGGGGGTTGVGGSGGLYGAGGGSSISGSGGAGRNGLIVITYTPTSQPTIYVLPSTAVSPWPVPDDWNAANNTVELIGDGGNGAAGTNGASGNGGGAGGAGQYVKLSNGAVSGSVLFQVTGAASGQATTKWEGEISSSSNYYRVQGGANATGTTNGAGGNITSTNGSPAVTFTVTTDFAGGAGGSSGKNLGGAGGGGSAGPAAAGGAGFTPTTTAGGGGGGANNGASGNSSGQTGGNGSSGSGGTAGNPGTGNSGGGGSNAGRNTTGGAGGSGTDFGSPNGLGGGGGGSGADTVNETTTNTGGTAGSYGGGGAGTGYARGTGTHVAGSGKPGLIVITYFGPSTNANGWMARDTTTASPARKVAAINLAAVPALVSAPPPADPAIPRGWSVEPPLLTWALRGDSPAAMSAAGSVLNPRPVVQPLPNGWTVEPPLLTYGLRETAPAGLFAASGSFLPPEPVDRPHPYGWTVEPPLLTYAIRDTSPAAQIAAGAFLPPQPTLRPHPYGWSVEPPLLTYTIRESVPGASFAGPSLPPQPVQQVPFGSNVALPDLPAFRRFQALPELSFRVDPARALLSAVWGGWVAELPVTRYPSFSNAAQFAGPALPPEPIERAQFGSNVTLPDLPAFRRYQALPEWSGALDFPAVIVAATPYGWVVELPTVAYPPVVERTGALAGPTYEPESILPTSYGWNVAAPDLPAFRRYQALPALIRRFDVTPGVIATLGWVIEPPITKQLAFSNAAQFAGPALPPEPILQPNYGWNVDLPGLPVFRRYQALPEITQRLDPIPGVVQATAYGWVVELPITRQPAFSNAAQFAGPVLPPESVAQPFPYGWTVALPDVPAFRRFEALPEWSGRLDFSAGTAFPAFEWGWTVEPPLLTYGQRGAAQGGTLAGPTHEPEPVLPTSYGWNVAIPDLPPFQRRPALPDFFLRVDRPTGVLSAVWFGWVSLEPVPTRQPRFSNAAQLTSGSSLPPQPVPGVISYGWNPEIPLAVRPATTIGTYSAALAGPTHEPEPVLSTSYGWNVALPDLPQPQRRQTFIELSWRVDRPTATFAAVWHEPPASIGRPARTFVLPEWSGRLDFVSDVRPVVWGWTGDTAPVRRFSTALAPDMIAPPSQLTAPVRVFSVVLPDLPQFRQFPALSVVIQRIDEVPPVRQFPSWIVDLPDLPAFRRYQALPETTNRLDQPSPDQGSVWFGWPTEQALVRRRPALARVQVTTLPPFVLPAFDVTRRYVRLAIDWVYTEVLGHRPQYTTVASLGGTGYVLVFPRESGGPLPPLPTLPPVGPNQVQTFTIDFGKFLPSGVTLTGSPTVVLTAIFGTDPDPQSRVSAGPIVGTAPIASGGTGVANASILVQVATCVPGVEYVIEAYCPRSDGDVAEASTRFQCNAPS